MTWLYLYIFGVVMVAAGFGVLDSFRPGDETTADKIFYPLVLGWPVMLIYCCGLLLGTIVQRIRGQ